MSWSIDGEIAIPVDGGIWIARFDDNAVAPELIQQIAISESDSVHDVAWSPDGSQLSLTAGSIGGSSIWIVNRDGTGLREIEGSTTGIFPAWSADGSKLAYLRAGMVFSADSSGYTLTIYDTETSSVVSEFDTGISGPMLGPFSWRPGATSSSEPADIEAEPTEPAARKTTPSTDRQLTLVPLAAQLHAAAGMIDGYLGAITGNLAMPTKPTRRLKLRSC